jgi:hypothetical protein
MCTSTHPWGLRLQVLRPARQLLRLEKGTSPSLSPLASLEASGTGVRQVTAQEPNVAQEVVTGEAACPKTGSLAPALENNKKIFKDVTCSG